MSVVIGGVSIGNKSPVTLIAGPCVIESADHAFYMAERLAEIANRVGVGFIFKASFDKANRTSGASFRGAGIDEALRAFNLIETKLRVPTLTDVHTVEQCKRFGPVVDCLQIPAFLCRQTDLLVWAAQTGRAVNIKKGQFLAPHDIAHAVAKVRAAGNENVLVTERGTTFGYNNLVVDMRSLPIMARYAKAPVIFDATHSVQQPGGLGTSSGGQREYVPTLARAAVAAGVAGIFVETHDNPDQAPSDGPNMIPLSEMESLLRQLIEIDRVVKKGV
jgi:2-dehydro-3-deoxyphosphooctonate aldolase (KDO 8-P synthase)